MNSRDFDFVNAAFLEKVYKEAAEKESFPYGHKTIGYYYFNVFKPVFEKELDDYFMDLFGCRAIIQPFPIGEGYFIIKSSENDPTFFKFYFYTDSGDFSASLVSNLVYVKFSYYNVSDDLFKISSKGYDDLVGKKFDHFINWGNHKNPTSDKQLIEDLSNFAIDMLGLTNNYKDFLDRRLDKVTGEIVF